MTYLKFNYLFEDRFSKYSDVLRYLELGLQHIDLGSTVQTMAFPELIYKLRATPSIPERLFIEFGNLKIKTVCCGVLF